MISDGGVIIVIDHVGIRCLVGGINLIKKIMIGILEQSCHRLAFAAEVVAALNEERIRETKVNRRSRR